MRLILPASLDTIRALRHSVLRPNQGYGTTRYPGDKESGTIHLAAYLNDCPIGIVSIYREAPPDDPAALNAYRLRGMAVLPNHQGNGHGAALLQEAITHAQRDGATLFWCNARTTARNFYSRHGFDVVGEAFEIEGIGEHYLMVRQFVAQ